MLPSSRSLETVAERADALRSTLGSMYLDGFVLDAASLRLWQRWVRGSITLEQLGSRLDDVIYDRHPEARIDPPVTSI